MKMIHAEKKESKQERMDRKTKYYENLIQRHSVEEVAKFIVEIMEEQKIKE